MREGGAEADQDPVFVPGPSPFLPEESPDFGKGNLSRMHLQSPLWLCHSCTSSNIGMNLFILYVFTLWLHSQKWSIRSKGMKFLRLLIHTARLFPKSWVFFFFFWSIIDLQFCVSFRYTAKWFSYIHIYILLQILLHYRLLQGTEYSSLYYMVNPYCLSMVACYLLKSSE